MRHRLYNHGRRCPGGEEGTEEKKETEKKKKKEKKKEEEDTEVEEEAREEAEEEVEREVERALLMCESSCLTWFGRGQEQSECNLSYARTPHSLLPPPPLPPLPSPPPLSHNGPEWCQDT
jgi:hypothetical protein